MINIRYENLDTARGIAALLVVLDHSILILWNPPPESFIRSAAIFIGSFAVGVFFLLSGFVIPFNLNLTTKTFLLRRFLRVYPVAMAGGLIAYGTAPPRITKKYNTPGNNIFIWNILKI